MRALIATTVAAAALALPSAAAAQAEEFRHCIEPSAQCAASNAAETEAFATGTVAWIAACVGTCDDRYLRWKLEREACYLLWGEPCFPLRDS